MLSIDLYWDNIFTFLSKRTLTHLAPSTIFAKPEERRMMLKIIKQIELIVEHIKMHTIKFDIFCFS